MTSPRRLFRFAPVLLALMSAVVVGDLARVACTMHGLGTAGATAMHGSHAGASEAAASGEHGAHHQAPAQPDQPDQPEQSSQDGCACSCIGDCSAAAVLSAVPTSSTLLVAVVEAQPGALFDGRATQTAPPEPTRLLPFANGPPLG